MNAPTDEAAATAADWPGFGPDDFAALAGAGEPAAAAALRAAAYAACRSAAVPTGRDEEWRRTDPALFPLADFRRLPTAARTDPAAPRPGDEEYDVVVECTGDAFSIRDGSGALAAGRLEVLPLAEAAARRPDLLARCGSGVPAAVDVRAYERLNAAFWTFGLLVRAPRAAELPRGVLIRHRVSAAGGLYLPRLVVVAEDGAEVRVVEQMESPADTPLFCLGARAFHVGPNAKLALVSLQAWGRSTLHLGEDWGRVARDGRVAWTTLAFGGQAGKLMVGCDVAEPNAEARLSGLYFADGRQHLDQRTLQLHSSPDTRSTLLYKGAVADTAHTVYQGLINAKPGAIRVDAYQMNNNLVLGEGARADSLPGLEIDADDLKCSHGSTMGNVDPDQIYYLRTRGLDEAAARELVVEGFFEEVLATIPGEPQREWARSRIAGKMGRA